MTQKVQRFGGDFNYKVLFYFTTMPVYSVWWTFAEPQGFDQILLKNYCIMSTDRLCHLQKLFRIV